MFYFVVIMAALAWLLLGFVGAYALTTKSKNEKLEYELEESEAWSEHWRLAFENQIQDNESYEALIGQLYEERDAALKCLELVIDESLKELTGDRT